MSNYTKGTKYEYKVKKLLEKEGYFVVRSAGSRSCIDLVAIGRKNIRLIQVKAYKEIYSPAVKEDYKKLKNIVCPNYVDKEIWLILKYKKANPFKIIPVK